jgi:hypothetical protein
MTTMNVYTTNGATAGVVEDNGSIYDAAGNFRGSVDHKGFVFNHMNLFVGYAQPATEELQTDDLHPHVMFTSATGKLDGCVDADGTIYELQPYQGELHLCNQGYVSLAVDLFLIGAAIWLLIGDTFVTLSTSASIL